MRCREVMPLLPALADEEPEGEVALHLASCRRCGAELAGYRDLLSSLSALEAVEVETPLGYLEGLLWEVPPPSVLARVRALAGPRAAAYAAASLGGLAVGAGAVGLVMWRRAHRTVREAATAPELAVSNL